MELNTLDANFTTRLAEGKTTYYHCSFFDSNDDTISEEVVSVEFPDDFDELAVDQNRISDGSVVNVTGPNATPGIGISVCGQLELCALTDNTNVQSTFAQGFTPHYGLYARDAVEMPGDGNSRRSTNTAYRRYQRASTGGLRDTAV